MSTQREQIDASMQQERIIAALTASFGVLALVLGRLWRDGIFRCATHQRDRYSDGPRRPAAGGAHHGLA